MKIVNELMQNLKQKTDNLKSKVKSHINKLNDNPKWNHLFKNIKAISKTTFEKSINFIKLVQDLAEKFADLSVIAFDKSKVLSVIALQKTIVGIKLTQDKTEVFADKTIDFTNRTKVRTIELKNSTCDKIDEANNDIIKFSMVRKDTVKKVSFIRWQLIGIIGMLMIITILSSTVTFLYYIDRNHLVAENEMMKAQLMRDNDELELLHSMQASKNTEIKELEEKLLYSAEYFNKKLQKVDQIQAKANNLIETLNASANTNINVPVTRGFDRTNQILNPLETPDEQNIYKEILENHEVDKLSEYIDEQNEKMSTLIEKVEDTLTYIECRPDARPSYGIITSRFGYRIHPITKVRSKHCGVDFGGQIGSPVTAAGSGVVTFSANSGGYGNVVVISHGYGYKTVYAHNSKILVKVGDHVKKGDTIAQMGNTGVSTGAHLHFEVHYNGTQIDPLTILDM